MRCGTAIQTDGLRTDQRLVDVIWYHHCEPLRPGAAVKSETKKRTEKTKTLFQQHYAALSTGVVAGLRTLMGTHSVTGRNIFRLKLQLGQGQERQEEASWEVVGLQPCSQLGLRQVPENLLRFQRFCENSKGFQVIITFLLAVFQHDPVHKFSFGRSLVAFYGFINKQFTFLEEMNQTNEFLALIGKVVTLGCTELCPQTRKDHSTAAYFSFQPVHLPPSSFLGQRLISAHQESGCSYLKASK